MRWQLDKKAAIVLFVCLAPCLPLLILAFDYYLITPIHECGHLLACWALGVQVLKVTWSGIGCAPVAGWRASVIGFMGGFPAAAVLCLIYVFIDRTFNLVSERVTFRLLLVFVLLKTIVMADIMGNVTAGVLEGLLLRSVYHQLMDEWPSVLIVLLVFSCFSLFWQLRKLTV